MQCCMACLHTDTQSFSILMQTNSYTCTHTHEYAYTNIHPHSQSQCRFRMYKCLSTFQCWLVMTSLHWWTGTLWRPAKGEGLCRTTLCRCSRMDSCCRMWAPLCVACHPDLCNKDWPLGINEGQIVKDKWLWFSYSRYWNSLYVDYISACHCMLVIHDSWPLSLSCSRTQTTVPHTLYRDALVSMYLATHCCSLRAMLWM